MYYQWSSNRPHLLRLLPTVINKSSVKECATEDLAVVILTTGNGFSSGYCIFSGVFQPLVKFIKFVVINFSNQKHIYQNVEHKKKENVLNIPCHPKPPLVCVYLFRIKYFYQRVQNCGSSSTKKIHYM